MANTEEDLSRTVVWFTPGDPDPDDHAYDGDGTSGCAVCDSPKNAHDPYFV